MGVAGSIEDSPIGQHLRQSFYEVAVDGQLTLREIGDLKPPSGIDISLTHPIILWKLDSGHDGVVSLEELMGFAEYLNVKKRELHEMDFKSEIHASCVMELWEVVSTERGQDRFVDWTCKLIACGEQSRLFDSHPGVRFLSRDAVLLLYSWFTAFQINDEIDQQTFLDLLQQVGEQMDLMALFAEELDDWVPLVVVQRFLKQFIQAYTNIFIELGLDKQ